MPANSLEVFELLVDYDGAPEMTSVAFFATRGLAEEALALIEVDYRLARHHIRCVRVHAQLPAIQLWYASVGIADENERTIYQLDTASFEPSTRRPDIEPESLVRVLGSQAAYRWRVGASGATRDEALARALVVRQEALDAGVMRVIDAAARVKRIALERIEAELGPRPEHGGDNPDDEGLYEALDWDRRLSELLDEEARLEVRTATF